MNASEASSGRFDSATLPSELERAASAWPDREAYVFEDGRLTFAAVARRAAAIATGLAELGVGPGARVAVLMAGYADWPGVYFGITAAGATLVPLNTRLAEGEIGELIVRSGAVAVIYQPDSDRGNDLQGRVRRALANLSSEYRPAHVISAGGEASSDELTLDQVAVADGSPNMTPASGLSSKSTCAIMYTSGSTGPSKGAILRHGALLRAAHNSLAALQVGQEDRFFSPLPFFHAGGAIGVMPVPVVTGATVVTQAYFDAGDALATMERERCTVTVGHQPHWVDYLAHPEIRSRRLALRAGYVIGDPKIRRKIYDTLGLVTVSPYGLTETHLAGASATLGDDLATCLETHGRPFAGVALTIRDVETDEPVGVDQMGEICLGGWCPMVGYLDDEQLTVRAYDSDGAIRTGDLGRVDADGNLRLVGRLKEMIRVGGENVSPSEVADVLSDHPSVKQAVVVPLEDHRLGEVPGAAIEFHEDSCIDIPAIETFCRDRLARYKVPRHIEAVTHWPMTGSGKIDRVAVRAHLIAQTREIAVISPDNPSTGDAQR